MTHKCCVRGCVETVKDTRSKGLPLHKFPKDAVLRTKWLSSEGFEPDFKPTASQIVCYKHFKQADYEVGRSHKLFLKKGSYPTIFSDYENHPDPINPDSDVITSRMQAREHKLSQQQQQQQPQLSACAELDSSSNYLDTSCSSLDASMDSSNSVHTNFQKKEGDSVVVKKEVNVKVEINDTGGTSTPSKCSSDTGAPKVNVVVQEETSSVVVEEKKKEKVEDPKSKVMNRAGLNFQPGSKLEAKDFNDQWYSARVVETDWTEGEVFIHFEKWSSRFDEWIPMDSSRLRNIQTTPQKEPKPIVFAVGDRCLATWTDGKKYPAQVLSSLGSNRYNILFDDGYSKVIKASKITKLVEAPLGKLEEENIQYHLPVMSNGPMTKQERRDKKRKHTVTELFSSKKKSKPDSDKLNKGLDSPNLQTVKYVKTEPVSGLAKTKFEVGADICPVVEYTGPVEQEFATYIGDLRIEIADGMYKCPSCKKNFRKENLIQMHIKHYHPEYAKFVGETPNVADLAYARTIGESAEDYIPKKPRTSTAYLVQAPLTPQTPQLSEQDSSQDEVDNKLDNKVVSDNNMSAQEDELSEKSNSCTMSPGRLFDLRFKEEKSHTGIKTLPPIVRQPPVQVSNDVEEPAPISNDIQRPISPADKMKSHRKRQQSFCDSAIKIKKSRGSSETEENYCHFSNSLVDGEDHLDLNTYNVSNGKIEEEEPVNDNHLKENNIIIENGEIIQVEKLKKEEIINCTCGITEEDGLMIQCDLCLCWQHGHCNAIEQEKDVPEKYICFICQHSLRQRPSKKYIHDQDWIKEGKLPSIYSNPSDVSKINERTAMLKRSYDLVAGLLQIQDLLHSLRVKVNIAQNKDHPKLYLWAKNWNKVKIPSMKFEPVPILEIVKDENLNGNYHNFQVKLECDTMKFDPEQKLITSDTELMKILEDQPEENKPLIKNSSPSSIKDEGNILLDALTKNGFDDQEQGFTIKNEISTYESPSKKNVNSRYFEKGYKFEVLPQPNIPEPEAPIDPIECKLRLLEHIDNFQNYVESTLDFIEAQISALEDVNAIEKSSDSEHVQTKQTIQMLLRDLETMRKLASLC